MSKHISSAKELSHWSPPISGEIHITQGWGADRSYRGPGATHHGVDISAPTGTPVQAIGDGRVISVHDNWVPGDGKWGGNTVIVQHSGGIISIYCHLSNIDVSVGETLTGGQIIGASGDTGGDRAFRPGAAPMKVVSSSFL